MKVFFALLTAFTALIACNQTTMETIKNPYERGLSFAAEGKFEKAADALKQISRAAPEKKAAEESLKVVETVLSGALDQKAAMHFFQGLSHANKGEFIQAYSYMSKAIKINPDFAEAYYERGSINGRMNLYERSVADFTRAAELNPEDAAAFNNRGLAYAKGFKDFERAIADFSTALKLDPEFAEAYENRGIAFMNQEGKKGKACADWKDACKLKRCRSYDLAMQNGYCR